jgi:hypothetical protein
MVVPSDIFNVWTRIWFYYRRIRIKNTTGKEKKYYTVATFPKSNRKILERDPTGYP